MRISTKRSSIDGDISLLMIYLEHCQKQEKTFKSKLDLVAKLPQQGKVCFDNDKVFHFSRVQRGPLGDDSVSCN